MKYKTKYTISEATELLKFGSRSTLNKKTKEGVLSYEKDANGVKIIDASELARVFPDEYNAAMNTDTVQYTLPKKAQESTAPGTENALVITLLNQQIEMLKEDLKRDRDLHAEREERFYTEKDELMNLVKNQNLMLTHHKTTESPAPSVESVISPVIPAVAAKKEKFYITYKSQIIMFISFVILLLILHYFKPNI